MATTPETPCIIIYTTKGLSEILTYNVPEFTVGSEYLCNIEAKRVLLSRISRVFSEASLQEL